MVRVFTLYALQRTNFFIIFTGIKFAGTSSIFSMKRRSGRPTLIQCMDRREEDLRICTLGQDTESSSD